MDFSALMNMFAPKPGMDPFAVGSAMANTPGSMVDQLATMGPPPPSGQSFSDWLTSKIQGPGNPPPSVSGAPTIPPMTVPPRSDATFTQPGGTQPPAITGPFSTNPTAPSPLAVTPSAYGNAANPRMGGPFPQAPQPNDPGPVPPPLNLPGLQGPPGYTGVEQVPGVGPVPTTAPPYEPDLQSGPTPASAITKTPPTKMAEAVPLPRPRPAEADQKKPAEAKTDPAKVKAIQEALKGMGGLLAGVKAPPPPETQKIGSPAAPRPTGTIQGGGITALLQQLTGAVPPPQAPLRLGNALYAGGRGIY